jgi:hypothetical protein
MEKGKPVVENYVLNQEVARRALYYMIILHEYSLSIVDHHGCDIRKIFISKCEPFSKINSIFPNDFI